MPLGSISRPLLFNSCLYLLYKFFINESNITNYSNDTAPYEWTEAQIKNKNWYFSNSLQKS